MPSLLIVHHTSSPSLQAMLDAVLSGAGTDEIQGVDVVVRPALAAGAVDVLAADGFVLGTSANIGYMSGALKHFFDLVYYPALAAKAGSPYGLYVHGNSDTVGAIRAVEAITTGMGWRQAHEHVSVIDKPAKDDLDACWDLGATVAATLAG